MLEVKKVQSAAGNRVQIWPEWVSKSAKGHCFWIVFADGSTEHQRSCGTINYVKKHLPCRLTCELEYFREGAT